MTNRDGPRQQPQEIRARTLALLILARAKEEWEAQPAARVTRIKGPGQ